MTAAAIHEVGAIFVHVAELGRSAAWYSQLLGLPLEPIEPECPIYCPKMDGSPGLILDDNRNNVGTERDVRPPFAFETGDCDAALRAFKLKGIPIVYEVEHQGKAFLFTFRDPFGNALMVMQDHGHDPSGGEAFRGRPSPVLNRVGGVSLRVGNLRRAAAWYSSLLGLPAPGEAEGDQFPLAMPGPTLTLLDASVYGPEQAPQFTLLTASLEQARSFVQEKGVEVLWNAPNGGSFTVRDPDGAVVAIQQKEA